MTKKNRLQLLRKMLLALAIALAAPWVHDNWGFAYRGPGMNQVELLVIVTMAGGVLAVAYGVLTSGIWWLLRKLPDVWLLGIDLLLAALFLWSSVEVGLTAKIETKPRTKAVRAVESNSIPVWKCPHLARAGEPVDKGSPAAW